MIHTLFSLLAFFVLVCLAIGALAGAIYVINYVKNYDDTSR